VARHRAHLHPQWFKGCPCPTRVCATPWCACGIDSWQSRWCCLGVTRDLPQAPWTVAHAARVAYFTSVGAGGEKYETPPTPIHSSVSFDFVRDVRSNHAAGADVRTAGLLIEDGFTLVPLASACCTEGFEMRTHQCASAIYCAIRPDAASTTSCVCSTAHRVGHLLRCSTATAAPTLYCR